MSDPIMSEVISRASAYVISFVADGREQTVNLGATIAALLVERAALSAERERAGKAERERDEARADCECLAIENERWKRLALALSAELPLEAIRAAQSRIAPETMAKAVAATDTIRAALSVGAAP